MDGVGMVMASGVGLFVVFLCLVIAGQAWDIAEVWSSWADRWKRSDAIGGRPDLLQPETACEAFPEIYTMYPEAGQGVSRVRH